MILRCLILLWQTWSLNSLSRLAKFLASLKASLEENLAITAVSFNGHHKFQRSAKNPLHYLVLIVPKIN